MGWPMLFASSLRNSGRSSTPGSTLILALRSNDRSIGSAGIGPALSFVLREFFVAFAMVNRIEQEVGDAALVERAKGGDADAWGVLVRRYMRRALSVAWGIVRNAHDAEDITQEALVKAFRKIESFRSGEAFGPWLLRIVTNLALDHHRAGRRRAEESLDEAMPARERTGAVAIETIAHRIDAAIESLPEMQRIVARLYLVEEMSHAEIATITELSEGTVRSHLSHARKKLQEMLRDVREESGNGTR